ncbi:hypothetical protein RI129_005006 [Pyrocoelia pectoralis]|uniref:N-acetyltransferase domain-containing protein n=1 Tax=Pyrocoelia pectoralis TaxID=417401 RepID=A0AAN7VEZ0_9COLE
MIDADGEVDLFDLCQVDCFLEMVFVAVLRSHRCRGIGVKLCEISINIARSLFNGNNVKTALNKEEVLPNGPIPKGACAIFTNKKSQPLGRKLNLSIATKISYEKFTFEGKTFAERLGSEEPCTTVEYITF